MNVLVTGGAGFLGINLVRYLLERNHNVVSLDFADFDYEDCKDKIKIVKGDIRNVHDVETAMQDIDIVVHTAAALPLYSEEDIMTTDVNGTKLLLESAFNKHNVKRFVHISSTAVYGIPDHHPLRETDKVDGVGPYGNAKIFAEEECLKFRNSGKCVPIIRPKSFIGPERLGVFALFYDWAKDGCNFPILGNGKNLYQFLDVEDLCDAIYKCIELPEEIANDTYNIGAKIFSTMKEDYQSVLDYAGFNGKIICIPEGPAIAILKLLEKLKLSPLYKWVYETAGKESFVSIEKAELKLGYAPKYSNKDALIRNYKWYLDNLKKFEGQTGVSHRVPWSQGILQIAKIFF